MTTKNRIKKPKLLKYPSWLTEAWNKRRWYTYERQDYDTERFKKWKAENEGAPNLDDFKRVTTIKAILLPFTEIEGNFQVFEDERLTNDSIRELEPETPLWDMNREVWAFIMKKFEGKSCFSIGLTNPNGVQNPKENWVIVPDMEKVSEDFLNKLMKGIPKEGKKQTQPLQYFPVPMHAEMQKFGTKPEPRQRNFFDHIQNQKIKEKAESANLTVKGIDHTPQEAQALHAIQKLLANTNYKGNHPGTELDGNNPFKMTGYLPAIKFTPAEFLEAYGLKRIKRADGKMQFSGEERDMAMKALISLAVKPNLFIYTRKHWETIQGQKEERIDRIETIQPLIKFIMGWENLSRYENTLLDNREPGTIYFEDKMHIAVEPCPILIHDAENYYLLKPANLYEEIKIALKLLGFKRPTQYAYTFLEWLLVEAEQKRRNKINDTTITIERESLVYKIRLEKYLERRQHKYIDNMIKNCLKTAKLMDYIKSYELAGGKSGTCIVMEINAEKLQRRKAEIDTLRSEQEIKQSHI